MWIVWELDGDRKNALHGVRGIFSIGLAIGCFDGGGICGGRKVGSYS